MAVAETFSALLETETMKHCGRQQANQAAADRWRGERCGRKHGGLEASRETPRTEVKSRVVPCWTGSLLVNSRYGWHSSGVMSSNSRNTLARS